MSILESVQELGKVSNRIVDLKEELESKERKFGKLSRVVSQELISSIVWRNTTIVIDAISAVLKQADEKK